MAAHIFNGRKALTPFPSVFATKLDAPPEGRSITSSFTDARYGGGYRTQSTASLGAAPFPAAPTPAAPASFPDSPAATPPVEVAPPASNIIPFANDAGEVQGPPAPTLSQQLDMLQQQHADFIANKHAEVAAIFGADPSQAVPPAAQVNPPADTTAPVVTSNPPAQFVSKSNQPQWNDITGGGEADSLYSAHKDPQSSADQTQRYYQRAYERGDMTNRNDPDRNRVARFNARVGRRDHG